MKGPEFTERDAVPADQVHIQKAQYKNSEANSYSPLLVHLAFRWDICLENLTAPTQPDYLSFLWLQCKTLQGGHKGTEPASAFNSHWGSAVASQQCFAVSKTQAMVVFTQSPVLLWSVWIKYKHQVFRKITLAAHIARN